MRFGKIILLALVGIFLAVNSVEVWAWMAVGENPEGGAKVEGPKKAQELRKAPAQAGAVRKATEFLKKIEGGVLYTESNKYSLSGVKVIDLTKNRKTVSTAKMPKKTVEMTFLNDQLKEVVIRQRQ